MQFRQEWLAVLTVQRTIQKAEASPAIGFQRILEPESAPSLQATLQRWNGLEPILPLWPKLCFGIFQGMRARLMAQKAKQKAEASPTIGSERMLEPESDPSLQATLQRWNGLEPILPLWPKLCFG